MFKTENGLDRAIDISNGRSFANLVQITQIIAEIECTKMEHYFQCQMLSVVHR